MKNNIMTLAALSIAIPGLALAQPMNGNYQGQKPQKPAVYKNDETKIIVKDGKFGNDIIIVKDDDRDNGYHSGNSYGNSNGYGNSNQYGYGNSNQYGYGNSNQYGYGNSNQYGYGNSNQYGNYYHGNGPKVKIHPPKYTKWPHKCGWGAVTFKTHKGYKVTEPAFMCRDFDGDWNIVRK